VVVGKGVSVRSLSPKAWEDPCGTTAPRPLSPVSIRSYPGTVRAFLSFLVKKGVLLTNPAARLPLPRARKLPRVAVT
jgi:site-specific recombinase XerC